MMSLIIEVLKVLTQEVRGSGNRIEKFKMLLILIAMPIAITFTLVDKHREEKNREANLVYHKQMESLNTVEQNIKDLITFVEQQKQQLRESEDLVKDLKSEEKQLRPVPVVEADRQVVAAILDAQSQRNRANVWKDRIIAFFVGVIASLVASVLFTAIRKVGVRRRDAALSDS
jgi:DNA repair exonuclease SbcCD ATPase subunit